MTVYIDVLIGLNLFVNYFLLLAVAKLTRYPLKNRRNLAAGFLLSLGSLVILLPPFSWPAGLLFRLLLAGAGVLAAFGFPSVKGFCRLTAALFMVTAAFGGIMLAIWHLFRPAGMAVGNGAVYFDLSPLLLTLSTLAAYGVLWLGRRLFARSSAETRATLHIQQGGRTLTVAAKLDTGFMLRDLYGDRPVVLLSASAAEKLFREETLSFRLIPYETVGGSGLLKSGLCQGVTVEYAGKTARFTNVVAAVAPREMTGEYKALIGCDLIERMEWNGTDSGTQKTVAHPHRGTHRLHKRAGRSAPALDRRAGAGSDGAAERGG